MKTYLLTLSEKQERKLKHDFGVTTRKDLARMLSATRVLAADFSAWTCTVCDNADIPQCSVTWRDTLHYVRAYLSVPKYRCRRSLLSRLASVLIRLLTFRLKPSQVS